MADSPISVAFSKVQDLPETAKSGLSAAERERADGFKAAQRRDQYLCARALLRALLQHYTGNPANSHELGSDDKGKPICAGGPAISIAHSGAIVMCAAAPQGEIGIDIEIPNLRHNIDGIAARYFAAEESAWLATQPEDRFFMLWVLKEAWLKAEGTGIAGGLDRLRCVVTPPAIDAHVSSGISPLLSLYALDDALIGIATQSAAHEDLAIELWDPQSGLFDSDCGALLVAATA